MGQPKFEIKNSTNNQFYFNLKAGNGEIILTSETYTAKQSCKDGITSVKLNAQDEGNYEKKPAINGKSYFNLKASNGQVIGTSEQNTPLHKGEIKE